MRQPGEEAGPESKKLKENLADMKSTLKYALIAVLGAAIVVPALAQDQFPDVPENHWAYEALENLKKEGCLVGYPDGLYRGGRPASRYEMAVALYACYKHMKTMVDGMNDQIKALTEKIDGWGDVPGDIKALRDQLAALQSTVDGMKAWGDDIAALKKMAETFEKELAALGVDVEALKKDLSDLEKRVTALEKKKPAVDIHGDLNILALGGNGDDRNLGITPGGTITGAGSDGYAGKVVGINRDFAVIHEAKLKFMGTNEEGPKWWATLIVGNTLSTLGGLSHHKFNEGIDEGPTDVTLGPTGVSFDTSIGGLGFSVEAGRIGYQTSNKYMFARTAYNDWFKDDLYDNGNWYFDGGLVTFKFGQAGVKVWAGRNSARNTTTGVDFGSLRVGPLRIDQSLGVELGFPLGDVGAINLAYLWLDTNSPSSILIGGKVANRANVYGGDINLHFGNFMVDGGYSKNTYTYNTSKVLDEKNSAAYANLGYTGSNWGMKVGFSRVEVNYDAPGDWGRLGLLFNPRNLEGANGSIWFQATPDFKLTLSGGSYQGILEGTKDDKVTMITGRLDYRLTSNWNLMAQIENTTFDRNVGSDPRQRWYTFGVGYNLGSNAKVDIRYQASDLINTKNFNSALNNTYRGGLLSTQITIKF